LRAGAIELPKSRKEFTKLSFSADLVSGPGLDQTSVELWTIVAIQVKHQIVFMALDIDGESIEAIDKCFVSEFLLPLAPLII
jgi:hypothetical protein